MFVLSGPRTPAWSASCSRGDGTILRTAIPRRSRSIGGLLGFALLLWGALIIGPSVARAAMRVATPTQSPEMTALFADPSYSPGQVARLRVVADATRLTVQPIAAFPRSADPNAPIASDPAVGPARTVAWRPGAGTVTVRIGRWASGVYFVRATSGREGVVAPVVVRPRLGQAPVAVVVPTFTWQAYNRRGGDTW
jgi:N,N-dimethylformamidase beta subunit-like, C-terminal